MKPLLVASILTLAALIAKTHDDFLAHRFQAPSQLGPLGQKVQLFQLTDETIFDGLARLDQSYGIPISIEGILPDEGTVTNPKFRAKIENETLADALSWLCSLDPRYRWTLDGTMVNFFPAAFMHDPHYLFNRQLPVLHFQDVGQSGDAAIEVIRQLGDPTEHLYFLGIGGTQAFSKPWTATFDNITVRGALNRIAAELGPTYGWQIGGTTKSKLIMFHYKLGAPPGLRRLAKDKSQPITVVPNLYWMSGSVPQTAKLTAMTVPPFSTQALNMAALLPQAGLANYNGSVNLVLDVTGSALPGGLLLASGSVDSKNTYVFQVTPEGIKESIAKDLSYWSTANGNDTMVTLWNPADEDQDFAFKLFYSGGHYSFPIHLPARATQMFNISEIIHGAGPDSEGNVIPVGTSEGSAELSGPLGENQYILVSMDAGIYNQQKATCGPPCKTCQGAVDSWITDNPFATPLGTNHQLTFTIQNHSGTQINDTTFAGWNSSDTSVATVSTGLVQPVAVGAVSIAAEDDYYPVYDTICSQFGITCPFETGVLGGGDGTVQVPTSLAGPSSSKTTYTGQELKDCYQRSMDPPVPAYYGYEECESYTVLDQNKDQIKQTGIAFDESLKITDTNVNPAPTFNNGSGSTDSDYIVKDMLSLGSATAPPPTGSYVLVKQTWTLHSSGATVRVNCLDFEATDVTVKDITSTPGATCSRN